MRVPKAFLGLPATFQHEDIRLNVYRCEYGCNTVTVDVAEGVTPFFIKCRAKPRPGRPLLPELTGDDGECIGQAQSCMYPRGPVPPWIGEPTHEWYKPEVSDDMDDATREHIERGGLLLRERTEATPIKHSAVGEPWAIRLSAGVVTASPLAEGVREFLLRLHDGYSHGWIDDDDQDRALVTIHYEDRAYFDDFMKRKDRAMEDYTHGPFGLVIADIGHADMLVKVEGIL